MAMNPLVAGAPTTVAVNAGVGPHFDVLEVGHPDYVALIEADATSSGPWCPGPRPWIIS